jgi:phosphate transport system protein
MIPMVRKTIRNAVHAYAQEDAETAARVLADDSAIDAVYGQIVQEVIARAPADPGHMAAFIDLLSVAKNLERIADHSTNISEDVIYMTTGSIVRHKHGEIPPRE